MTAEVQALVFRFAQQLAEALGEQFIGQVEINIFRGGVGNVNVRETLMLKQSNHEQRRETT